MKILQVAERTYPARGGVELHTAKISEAMVRKGHKVTLVVFNSVDPHDCGYGITYQKPRLVLKPARPKLAPEERWKGVRILRFESRIQFLSYYWSPTMLAWLLENAEQFDIMHTHTLRFSNNEFTALGHLKSKTPFVFTGHDKLRLDYMGPLVLMLDRAYAATLGKLLLKMASRVIAFDQDCAKDYVTLYGVEPGKIRIVPNGIDCAHYDDLNMGRKLAVILGRPSHVILYLGRFIDYKRPDLLIAAFKEVATQFPDARLLMIGKDYGFLPSCKELATRLGLTGRVTFIEDAEERVKLQALSIADVCVVPSEYETFGLVALEAQASGIPVIATRLGGLKYLLKEGETGFFLRKKTPAELAHKIVLLLRDPELRERMGTNGRKFAMTFSWDAVSDRLLRVYEEVLS